MFLNEIQHIAQIGTKIETNSSGRQCTGMSVAKYPALPGLPG